MTMFHLERELRRTNDPHDEERADQIAVMLKGRGKDVSLPVAESRVRRPFSSEEKEVLAKEGLTAVYPFTGKTIADQIEEGRKFRYMASSDNNSLVAVRSIIGDVTVDPRPNKFFLPKSNNSTLDQLLEMVAEYSYKLQRMLKTDSVEAILGEAPDYTEIAFAHLDKTGERFFGEKYDYNYAGTKTPTVGRHVASVGHFVVDYGLGVVDWDRGHGDGGVFAVPLVVAK